MENEIRRAGCGKTMVLWAVLQKSAHVTMGDSKGEGGLLNRGVGRVPWSHATDSIATRSDRHQTSGLVR